MLNKIEGHGMDELVLDIIINPTTIIQTQIGSWVNWSWTSGRATEAQPPSPLISYQSLTTFRQPLFLSWEYLIIL